MRCTNKPKGFFLFMVMLLASACVTVNIYFPAAKVEKIADEIVDDVYKNKDETPSKEQKAPDKTSMLETVLAYLGPKQAHAANATTVSNASIRALKQKISANHRKLARYYQKGKVGINKNGMLSLRDTKGLNMRDLAGLKRLVSADNAARKNLYSEVAKALNIKPNQVSKVQSIFADQWRNKARKGWWIQDNSGKWRRK